MRKEFSHNDYTNTIPYNIFLCNLSNFGLPSSYADRFHNYLISNLFCLYFWRLSFPYLVKSGVPQGCTLCLLPFNICVNDIRDSIKNSKYLLFADDLKTYSSSSTC